MQEEIEHPQKYFEIRKAYFPLLIYVLIISFIYDALLVVAVSVYFSVESQAEYSQVVWILAVLFAIKTILLAFFSIKYLARLVHRHHYFEGNTLVEYEGFYYPKQKVYPLNYLRTIEISTPYLVGHLMKYGSVRLHFLLDNRNEEVNLGLVVDPGNVKKHLSKYLNKTNV